MKNFFKLSSYFIVYILFVVLYSLNFKDAINFESLRLCLYSSITPALVGGTVTSLLLK